MNEPMQDQIEHRENAGRGEFFIEREGKRIAELTYSSSGPDVVVGHTWVDPGMRGGTLAPRLVRTAVEWARQSNMKIVPVCSYVRAVFGRTPQYADVWKR